MTPPLAAFIEAATVPLDGGHATGTLDRANEILAAHPDLAGAGIHAAAVLGEDVSVRRFLSQDAGLATRSGPRGWDPLTCLCFSRFLRLDRARSDGFVRAATALLDAGARATTGWYADDHDPPEFESALYGAAGVAHHAGLTRLLLARGADPNDAEVVYHTPETCDNAALHALVEAGGLSADSLAAMLLRKHDWHDEDGVRYLLAHGADPNRVTWWGYAALHQAVRRDNATAIVALLLDHGADPAREAHGRTAVAIAARRGRGDLLSLFADRGVGIDGNAVDRLLAACARGDAAAARAIAAEEPCAREQLAEHGGAVLAQFAGVGNAPGVRRLLDLGIPVDARYRDSDAYFDLTPDSTALHAAAWRARHAVVRLLLARGAAPDARDGKGRTPLMLAVRACVDSYWTELRAPDSVAALLDAGASPAAVRYPSGYAEVDALLQRHGARAAPDDGP